MIALTHDQASQLLARFRDRYIYMPVLIGLFTGMRRGEICALRWDRLDLDKGTAEVLETATDADGVLRYGDPKSVSSKRTVDLSKELVFALKVHRLDQQNQCSLLGLQWEPTGFVCLSSKLRPLVPHNLGSDYKHSITAMRKSDPDLPLHSFHTLRHTYITWQLEGGAALKYVQEQVGHANANMILRVYAHVTASMRESAQSHMGSILGQIMPK
jgi:integrase